MSTDYLSEQFSRRPLLDADVIIAERGEYVGGANGGGDDAPVVLERWDIMAAVEDLHNMFWSMDAQAFASAADAVNTNSYPSYAAEIERLRTINACRDDYDRLEDVCSSPDEERFVGLLRRIAVASRHTSIVIREQLVYSLAVPDVAVETLPAEWYTDEDAARRGEIGNAIRRIAGVLRGEFPNLYAIAPEWYDRLTNHQYSVTNDQPS
jgi:hypothetical protein